MIRTVLLLLVAGILVACTSGTSGTRPGDGRVIFKIGPNDAADIQFRMIDAVNELRSARGLQPLSYSAELIAASKTHAFDIARQNRPWHFGSDGSSPIDRAARAGFENRLLGENISETYEDDISTLNAWMTDASTRDTLLDPQAVFMGFSWHQQNNGKIWWVLTTGSDQLLNVVSAQETALIGDPIAAAEAALEAAEIKG